MTTLPQTTTIRLPRQATPAQTLAVPSVPGMPMAGAGGKQMTAGDVWRVIRSNLWLIIASLVVFGVGGYFVNKYLAEHHSKFTATGYLAIQPPVRDLLDDDDTSYQIPTQNLAIEQRTQAQLLRHSSLLSRVIQNSAMLRDTSWFKQFETPEDAKADLMDSLSVSPLPDSKLVMISMSYSDPKDCRDIVEAVVNEHIRVQQDLARGRELERSRDLNNFKQRYQFTLGELRREMEEKGSRLSIDGGGTPGRLTGLELELSNLLNTQLEMKLNADEAEQMYQTVMSQLQQGVDPPMIEEQINLDPMIAQYRAQFDAAEVEYAMLHADLGAENPLVIRKKVARDEFAKRLETTIAEKKATLRASLADKLRAQEQSTKQSLQSVTKRVNDVKGHLAELSITLSQWLSLRDEEEATRELLKQVNTQLDNIVQMESRRIAGIEWATHPEIPDEPSFPKLPITMSIAVMLGLALSLGIAFLRELMDTTVRSPQDIQRVGQLNLLGLVVDERDDPQSEGARLPLAIFEAPHSMMAEQLRQVRSRLQHAASLDTTRSILVTSPSPSDGKSTIACNLAAGLALNGRRILLVDANFRRPELHKVFGIGNEIGFSDTLVAIDRFGEAVRPTQVPNLDVLATGPKPANAPELLESQLLVDFIERALEEYDHVIFDSGPLLVVSETVALAPRVDGVITVVRARSNSRGLLTRMRDSLRQIKAEHLGVILNAVRAQGGGYYGRNIKTYYAYQNGHSE